MKKILAWFPEIAIGGALAASFWQTRLIVRSGSINGAYNEYLTLSLYASQLLWIIAFFIFIYRRGFGRPLRSDWRALGLLLVFSWPLLTLVWAPDHFLGFFKYFFIIVAVIAAWLLSGSRGPWNKIFVWSLIPSALLGLWQFFSQSSFACKYLGLAYRSSSALAGESVIETASGRWLRAYGSFDHPNIFGSVLVAGFILASSLLLSEKISAFQKRFYYAAALLFAAGVFLSFSRSAWIALVFALALSGIQAWRRSGRTAKNSWLTLIGLVLLINGFLAWQCQDLWLTRLATASRLEQRSVSDRVRYGYEANQMIKQHWLFGVGLGQYIPKLRSASPSPSSRPAWDYQPVHDLPRLLWAEIGIIGLFLAAAVAACLWRRLTVGGLALVGSLAIAGLTDHWLFSLPFGLLFFGITIGLAFKEARNNI